MDIKLSNISVILPGCEQPLFRIKSMVIGSGSKILIHGPSGIGKTTLLHLIAGMFLPSEGYVYIGTDNLNFLSEAQRCNLRRSHFGIVFQRLNLIDHLTAFENVRLTSESRGTAWDGLKCMGVEHLSGRGTADLSLGEQQRVAIARAYASRPKILLADEPTSSLDDDNAHAVIKALISVPSSPTIIVVSHDNRIREYFDCVKDFRELA